MWVDPHTLKRNPRNPRNNDAAVAAVARSIEANGFGAPIVARSANRMIIAGDTRWRASVEILKLPLVPVRFHNVTQRQADVLTIADNRLGELAEWDDEKLADMLKELDPDEQVLAGFEQDDVDELLAELGEPPEITEDEVPELPKVPVTKPGDVWVLGRHRLVCGDCTVEPVVTQCMQGQRASCVFTDPPYGVAIGAKNRMLNEFQRAGRNLDDIEDDALSPDDLKARLLPAFTLLRTHVLADDATVYVTSPQGGELCMMMLMMRDAALPTRHVLIWKKSQPTFSMGRLDYDYQHEPILLTWGKRHKRPLHGKHRTSVWEIDKPRQSAEHPTMKPVELYANAYLNNSDAGDLVADIYAGSGTAFAAAEQLGRTCFGIELSPAYCDVIVERWQNLTGQKAQRQ